MMTLGLNRPLFSFGLSYPGYFFVVVPPEEDDGTKIVFRVREPNRFRAWHLADRYLIKYANSYIAIPSQDEIAIDLFAALESARIYIPWHKLLYLAYDVARMTASESSRNFSTQESKSFNVGEAPRRFIAVEDTTHAEIYRN